MKRAMFNRADLNKAVRAGKRRAAEGLWARSVHYARQLDSVVFEISKGLRIGLPRSDIAEFAQVHPKDMDLTLSPAGDVLHLDRLDIHVSVEGLIRDLFLPSIPANMLSSALGRFGGSARSESKSAAARNNGRKGGRPRKTPEHAAA